jgi:acetylornithine/succinyldiaminopimelate/putrescine aminotransferase
LLPPLIVTEPEIEEAIARIERACLALSTEPSRRAVVQ